jgi:hypothetical protein
MKFKLLWENGLEISLKSSTATSSTNVFSTGGVVMNEGKTTWKK